MSLTEKQKTELNNWDNSEPALKKGILRGADALKMGDILDKALSPVKTVQVVKNVTLADAATTVVSLISNVRLGDTVVAILTLPNTGATIATALSATVTANEEVTVTPDATPSNADGFFDLIITRPTGA